MGINLLRSAIKYYFPWLIIVKRQIILLINRKNYSEIQTQKANSRYCYSVWLRHLSIINENGLDTNPNIVAELGPGDSIGMGLMALLTGSSKYYALDIVEKTNVKQNPFI